MHPYEFLTQQNPNGLDQFVAAIKHRIAEIDVFISKYADEDGMPELADKDTLYQLFKRGVAEGLVCGLREMFLHYYCIFKKQVLLEMINEHPFDSRDKEILEYFHDVYKPIRKYVFNGALKCPSFLVTEKTFILCTGNGCPKYVGLFYTIFAYAYDAYRKVQGNTELLNPSINLDFNFEVKSNYVCRNAEVDEMKMNEIDYLNNMSERAKTRSKRYRDTNKEKLHSKNKEYRDANKEQISERWKQYVKNNREKRLEYQRQYNKEHRDEIIAAHKVNYQKNKEKRDEYQRKYREAHKAEKAEYYKKYKATRRNGANNEAQD